MDKLPLKAHRAIHDMTQQQVADVVGVGRTTYAKWEDYESYPNAIQLIKLAKAFNCSMDALYFPVDTN